MQKIDYKSLLLDLSFRDADSNISEDSIRPVASSFVRNANQIVSLAKMPFTLMNYASWLGLYAGIAYHQETGKYAAGNPELGKELSDKIGLRISVFMQELIERDDAQVGLNSRDEWQRANKNLEVLDEHLNGTITRGVGAVLASVVTGAWTTFEALAGDLWEAAVNAKPGDLALLTGKENRILKKVDTKLQKRESAQESTDSEDSKLLNVKINELSRITRNTFNLSDKMGTLLKNKYKFTSLNGIRKAYAASFDDHADSIDDVLKNKQLDALSIIRNLVVHKTGVADQVYIDDAKAISGLPALAEKQPLELNGELVRGLVDPVLLTPAR